MSEYYRNYCMECDGFFLDYTPVCPVCGGACPSQSDRDEARASAVVTARKGTGTMFEHLEFGGERFAPRECEECGADMAGHNNCPDCGWAEDSPE